MTQSVAFGLMLEARLQSSFYEVIDASGASYGFSTRRTFNSLEDMLDAVVGNWAIVYDPFDNSLPEERYEFSISSLELGDLFASTPTFLSPGNGATVPNRFTLDWEYQGGAEPGPSVEESVSYFPITGPPFIFSPITFAYGNGPDQTSAVATASLPATLQSQEIRFQLGAREDFSSRVSPVTYVSQPPPSRDFNVSLRFQNFSESIALNVLSTPTPCSFALMLPAFMWTAAGRRRQA